jgi:hypothetical protein
VTTCLFKRHPCLFEGSPKETSAVRVKQLTPDAVKKFFSILETEMDKIGHFARRMFNVNVTDITVHGKQQKVDSSRGKKQVSALTSAERGNLSIVIMCVNEFRPY